MVLPPSVRSSATIRAFTKRLLSNSAFIGARIGPDFKIFGRTKNFCPVPSGDLRLNTAHQKLNGQHVALFLAAQNIIEVELTLTHELYNYIDYIQ